MPTTTNVSKLDEQLSRKFLQRLQSISYMYKYIYVQYMHSFTDITLSVYLDFTKINEYQ